MTRKCEFKDKCELYHKDSPYCKNGGMQDTFRPAKCKIQMIIKEEIDNEKGK
jgi:hypothetical protein